jgi:hypothetical protein
MLLKSPNRRKSEVTTGGGLDSGTGAVAFNGSYVGTVRSGAFGQDLTLAGASRVAASVDLRHSNLTLERPRVP